MARFQATSWPESPVHSVNALQLFGPLLSVPSQGVMANASCWLSISTAAQDLTPIVATPPANQSCFVSINRFGIDHHRFDEYDVTFSSSFRHKSNRSCRLASSMAASSSSLCLVTYAISV